MIFNGAINGEDLLLHVDVVCGEVSKPGEILDALFAAASGEQPSRGFVDDERATEEDTGGDELDGKGNNPLSVRRSHSLGDTVVDPEADETTDLPCHFVEANETPADSRRSDLRAVDGREIGGATNSHTC